MTKSCNYHPRVRDENKDKGPLILCDDGNEGKKRRRERPRGLWVVPSRRRERAGGVRLRRFVGFEITETGMQH